jgi:hypothetical protein
MSVQEFLKQAKANAITKGKEMAKLELTIWNEKHETELKKFHGFTDATLSQRKLQLSNH